MRGLLLAAVLLMPAKPGLVDINTATPAELAALPGMGREYVRRVIANRPYTAKNQLATRGVLPAEEYGRIADMVVAHRPQKAAAKASPDE